MQEARPTARMSADAYWLLGAHFVEDDIYRATTYWLKSISIQPIQMVRCLLPTRYTTMHGKFAMLTH